MFIVNLFRGSKNAVTYEPGQVIFTEGEPGDSMFVVLEGEVEIRVHDKVIDTSHPGELLGEMVPWINRRGVLLPSRRLPAKSCP